MNITDSIIDKILYKELVANATGNFTKRYEVGNINPSSGNVVVFNTMFKVGGSISIFFDNADLSIAGHHINPLVQIYVNDELKYTSSTNVELDIQLSFPAFAKVKMIASTTSGTMRTMAKWGADLKDKYDMYFSEVVE